VGRYDGNIVVLLDDQCYSCGEVFVQCMKEWSDATVVGKPSPGFVVTAQEYDLSEGYRLLLPFGEMWSGKDAKIEGVGVSPHVPLDLGGKDDGDVLSLLSETGVFPN
jgi:C-terminal processing protease CtpA/Prc